MPGDPEDVDEHALGQPMPSHQRLGHARARCRQRDVAVLDRHVPVGDQSLDALGDGGRGESEALADAGLDDPLALLLELVDRFEVLLGGGVQIAKIGSVVHVAILLAL